MKLFLLALIAVLSLSACRQVAGGDGANGPEWPAYTRQVGKELSK